MRHADSSPSIPPRFVACARRYHPSTCGSLRRTPGAASTASGLVSRCPPPGGLYDGDDEASRVPGKPTRTHATRSDPGEAAASTASEMRRDSLPSNARRRPSQTMHFGCFRYQLLLPRPYLVLTKPLRLDIQCQRGASVKIGWKYLDDYGLKLSSPTLDDGSTDGPRPSSVQLAPRASPGAWVAHRPSGKGPVQKSDPEGDYWRNSPWVSHRLWR